MHSLVRALFPTNSIPEVPQAGRIKLLFKLVQTYTRSQYPKYCSRVRNFFSQKSCAGKIAQPSSFESGTIQAGWGGTKGNVVERCNAAGITMQNSVSQQPFSSIKEGWG